MPTATPFTALGEGNGFNVCVFKQDVSFYNYWTTLGGANKNNPTPSPGLIAESLRLAMKLFWNADSLNCTANATDNGSVTTVQVNYATTDFSDPFDPVVTEMGVASPVDRVCIPSIAGNISTDFSKTIVIDDSAVGRFFPNGIVAMYNGSTFVGYGLGFVETRFVSSGTIKAEAGGSSQLNAGVYVGSYGYTPANTSNDVFDAGYVTFEGMNLFAYVEAKNRPTLGVAGSVNLSALSATCTNSNFQQTANASIDSINFYTY
jgi:hypothetical protein